MTDQEKHAKAVNKVRDKVREVLSTPGLRVLFQSEIVLPYSNNGIQRATWGGLAYSCSHPRVGSIEIRHADADLFVVTTKPKKLRRPDDLYALTLCKFENLPEKIPGLFAKKKKI